MHCNYSFTLGHAVYNIPIYELIYSLMELYITESIFRFFNMAITLELNFTYICHIRGMPPFHMFMAMLTELYMLQPF